MTIIYSIIDIGIVEIPVKREKIIVRGKIMNYIKKVFLGILLGLFMPCFAAEVNESSMSTQLSFGIPNFTRIYPVTSPVLTANITDRTGNLHTPLSSTFRVITNSDKTQALFLKASVNTDAGLENAMFEQGGRVYIAFANLAKIPASSSLANCKLGGIPKDSPGIVAYPVLQVRGADNKYIPSKEKYEVYVDNGKTDVTVDVGSNVLRSSFASNDPRGFYQAILSLTEADI